MTRDYFFYAVQSELRFTEHDVDILMRCSKRHYDAKCRGLSVGGFIAGMKNQFYTVKGEERPKDATRNFSWQDLDITCKVLEGARNDEEAALYGRLRELFAEARKESERLNAHCR